MNISHNIKLQEKSYQIIEDVYSRYKRANWDTKKILIDPIIHIKPAEDTIQDYGELHGYEDSLLFTLHVFDLQDNTMMTINNRDELNMFYDESMELKFIRIFKDGSTLIRLRGRYQFGSAQSVVITRL